MNSERESIKSNVLIRILPMLVWNSQIQLPLLVWLVSFLVSIAIVWTKHLHGHLTFDGQSGAQKIHHEPTPRIGGLAIFIGMLVAVVYVKPARWVLLWPMLASASPALIFGLLEDVTKKVSSRSRLFATMSCAILGWLITGVSITDVNTPGLDWLLQFSVISVAFTAVAVAGVANAINIVDGLNGMAAGCILIILIAMAYISNVMGDIDIYKLCVLFCMPVFGFLVINWPFGKLFLGDGGAYFMGFTIGWLAVLLLQRHSEISAWAMMLVCGHPVIEVAFSIWRRVKRNGSIGSADGLHLHSLVMRRVVRRLLPHSKRYIRNSAAGSLMWFASLIPASMGVLCVTNNLAAILCLMLCVLLYILVYRRIVYFKLRSL